MKMPKSNKLEVRQQALFHEVFFVTVNWIYESRAGGKTPSSHPHPNASSATYCFLSVLGRGQPVPGDRRAETASSFLKLDHTIARSGPSGSVYLHLRGPCSGMTPTISSSTVR